MTSKMKELCELMPPPADPICNSGDWAVVEADLERRLPGDYKDFISVYGSGKINDMVMIENPFDMEKGDTFRKGAEGITRTYYSNWHDQLDFPYPLFPSEGCLLPFASTDNGDYFNWETNGDPNKWEMVFWKFPGRKGDVYEFHNGFVASFVELFSEKKEPFWRIFDREEYEGPSFESFKWFDHN